MQFIGIGVLVAAFFMFAMILNGFVVSLLWQWFVVETFNIPALSLAQAIGLSGLVTYMTTTQRDFVYENSDETQEQIRAMAIAVIKPFAFCGIGYLVYQFV